MSLGKVDGFVHPSSWFSELDPALKINLDRLVEIIKVIISKILRTLLVTFPSNLEKDFVKFHKKRPYQQ